MPQPWWVKGLAFMVTVASVAAVFWLLFLIGGVPGFLPDNVEKWLTKVPGLAD
jgi:UDP-N-acetyl-D-mannosaminuronic acid transferase (WecB/TagA/CpsF family)